MVSLTASSCSLILTLGTVLQLQNSARVSQQPLGAALYLQGQQVPQGPLLQRVSLPAACCVQSRWERKRVGWRAPWASGPYWRRARVLAPCLAAVRWGWPVLGPSAGTAGARTCRHQLLKEVQEWTEGLPGLLAELPVCAVI